MVDAKSLVAGLKEIVEYKEGRVNLEVIEVAVPDVDVKEIRTNLQLSQDKFAKQYGLSVATIRNWEHGVRKPEGPARVLLHLIAQQPQLVAREIEKLKSP